MLRTLVHKLRRWNEAGPGCPFASGGRAVAALEDGNHVFMAKGEVQPEAARRPRAGAVTSDYAERWMPTMAEPTLRKYLSKMSILACQRGMGDRPDDTSPLPPPQHNLPVATTTVLLVPGACTPASG